MSNPLPPSAPRYRRGNPVARALKAAAAAGIPVARIEIDAAGKTVIVTGAGATAPTLDDELDRELEEFEASSEG